MFLNKLFKKYRVVKQLKTIPASLIVRFIFELNNKYEESKEYTEILENVSADIFEELKQNTNLYEGTVPADKVIKLLTVLDDYSNAISETSQYAYARDVLCDILNLSSKIS